MTKYLITQFTLSALLLVMYHFAYRSRAQYNFNRGFLITSLLFSIVIPFIEIDAFPVYQTLSIPIASVTSSTPVMVEQVRENISAEWIYFSIVIGLLVYTLLQVVRTFTSMKKAHSSSLNGDYSGKPMSFLHLMAVPDKADKIVVAHEQYHVMAGHSWDRILFSILHAFLWINPLLFMYKRWLIENHEIAADAYSIRVNDMDTISYSEHLVQVTKRNIILPANFALPNHYYSLILNPIQMLDSKKHPSFLANILGLLLFIMLFCSFTLKTYTVTPINQSKISLESDTIPPLKSLIETDTVLVFNTKSKKEYKTIVKAPSSTLEDYLKTLKYSGNMVTRTDTITTFNYDTYEETVRIVKVDYPIEIENLLKKMPYDDHDVIIKMAKELMPK